jgi:hypothetical protein
MLKYFNWIELKVLMFLMARYSWWYVQVKERERERERERGKLESVCNPLVNAVVGFFMQFT